MTAGAVVRSADGTAIAYDRAGDGPALVVAVGAFCDRRTFVPPERLTDSFTVYTYDRRGRGDSGDTPPYSPDREVADLAAVIEAAGGAAFCYGHSSGAALVLRAAAQGVPVTAAAAYEPPYIIPGSRPVAADPAARIRSLVEAGRRGDAVRYWMTDVVQAPAHVLAMMEGSPAWPALEAMTPTLPYDLALTGAAGIPASQLAGITVPVLVMGGGNSPDWFQRTVRETAAAIPGARLELIPGHDHGIPPEVLTEFFVGFFLGA
jgi:pimeloyl-ACP methyl ester carboxylesterase